MTEQIVRELVNGEWVTTYAQVGGGGSSPLLSLAVTKTAADLNATSNQATSIQIIPAPGAGLLIAPFCVFLSTPTPDTLGNTDFNGAAYGTTGNPITLQGSLTPGGGLGNFAMASFQGFGAAGDVDKPLNMWLPSGIVDGGPYTINWLYALLDVS